jgi:CDP-alcohol phosphatidyltransferase
VTETQSASGEKKLDYWWTVLCTDPIAIPLARTLAPRRLPTADQVSALAIAAGLGVGPLFALGTRLSLLSGGLLFYIAFLLDCVDGKLARARGTVSTRGEGFDRLGDAARRASASAGLLVWLWRYPESSSADFRWGVAYVVAAYLFFEVSGGSEVRRASWGRRTDDNGEPTSPPNGFAALLRRHRLLPNPGMPDVQALVFIIGPVSGLVVPALWLGTAMVGIGTAMNAVRLLR